MSLTDDLNKNILDIFDAYLKNHKKPKLSVSIKANYFQNWKEDISESAAFKCSEMLKKRDYLNINDEYEPNQSDELEDGLDEQVSFLNDRALAETLLNVFDGISNDFNAPIYIGSSGDLKVRLAQHKSKFDGLFDDLQENKNDTLQSLAVGKNIGFAGRAMLNQMQPSQIVASVISFNPNDTCSVKVGQVKHMAQFLEYILNKCHTPILGKR
jgi:hypothetical protein